MNTFTQISPVEIKDNVFKAVGKDWMLITAGDDKGFNTMTASWGGLGVLWNKSVAFTFIRKQRYTYEFTEDKDLFTLCFFDEDYRNALSICGSKSGRDIDKVKETGLTPVHIDGTTYFDEARLVLVCKKQYFQDIDPKNFLNADIEKNYPAKDYHRMYIGEIVKVLVR